MSVLTPADTAQIYRTFTAPLADLNCGEKCAPHNNGVPFCCDTLHAVPTAYKGEWAHLQKSTDLWHIWEAADPQETLALREETGPNLILIECQGHTRCQRDFRSIICRAFPFFPYFSSAGDLLGLAYYWEYEYRCWVISNLQIVTDQFRGECLYAYEQVFAQQPAELASYQNLSAEMRLVFDDFGEQIFILHKAGGIFKIDPTSEAITPAPRAELPKFEPYT